MIPRPAPSAITNKASPGNQAYLDYWMEKISTSSPKVLTNCINAAAGGYFSIGGTYCEAVPEPASMAVLGFGALAMLRRRKKA